MIIPILLFTLTAPPSGPSDAADPPPPVVVSTLHMNPEKPREIVGWWVGPEGLIEVSRDGRYRRWPTIDRFSIPKEQGRWHRDNHAVFWLEPYTIPRVSRHRAALWLRDDALMSDISGDDRPFEWRKTPPAIPADGLLGVWEGPGGILEFGADRRFRWSAPVGDDPAMLAGQRGIWSLDADGRLTFLPMLASQAPAITIERREEDGRIVQLRSPQGVLTRRPPPTDPESKTPAPSKTPDTSSNQSTGQGEGPASP